MARTPIARTNRPESGRQLASKPNRGGLAERVADPAGPKSIEVDLALLGHDDERRRDVERSLLTTAKPHDAHPCSLLRTGPGIGEILSLGRLYARHDSQRCPRGQDVVSDGRLGTCANASAGKRYGPSGPKLGTAELTWAVAEAAVLFLRAHPTGPKSLGRREKTPGQGQALPVWAHQRARAVSDLLKRDTAFARPTCRTNEPERSG